MSRPLPKVLMRSNPARTISGAGVPRRMSASCRRVACSPVRMAAEMALSTMVVALNLTGGVMQTSQLPQSQSDGSLK